MQKIPNQQKIALMQSTAPIKLRSKLHGQLPRHDVIYVEIFLAHADIMKRIENWFEMWAFVKYRYLYFNLEKSLDKSIPSS